MQNNGSLYLHAFITKSGSPPNPHQPGYKKQDMVAKIRCMFMLLVFIAIKTGKFLQLDLVTGIKY
jgi:hypothetical protein